MAGLDEAEGGAGKEAEEEEEKKEKEKEKKSRPTLTLPPRMSISPFGYSIDVSPGPMTLVSSMFAEYPDSACTSYTDLLAGAMASPGIGRTSAAAAAAADGENSGGSGGGGGGGGGGGSESKSRGGWGPPSPLFFFPPGLLDSPNFFGAAHSPYGMSHQQALAHVTAQAALSHTQSRVNDQVDYPAFSASATTSTAHPSSSNPIILQQAQPQTSDSKSADDPHTDTRSQSTCLTVDKPADDGYNWRKYGQKQVKGSEFPRSYYKCTHTNCPVKKKVERSLDGQVTEIIYKGQHNHEQPPPGRRSKESGALPNDSNGIPDPNGNCQTRNFTRTAEVYRRDCESGQTTAEQPSGVSDVEEVGTINKDEDLPGLKRRNLDTDQSKSGTLHKTITEPRVIVQTQSEVDLLDDGYRWRKYGQKVVKGNPHPRSYYKCTYTGCTVRKHVERASTDAKAVVTTYEGKHNHDVPAARNSSHLMSNVGAAVNVIRSKDLNPANNQMLPGKTEYQSSDQNSVAVLQLKEHNIT